MTLDGATVEGILWARLLAVRVPKPEQDTNIATTQAGQPSDLVPQAHDHLERQRIAGAMALFVKRAVQGRILEGLCRSSIGRLVVDSVGDRERAQINHFHQLVGRRQLGLRIEHKAAHMVAEQHVAADKLAKVHERVEVELGRGVVLGLKLGVGLPAGFEQGAEVRLDQEATCVHVELDPVDLRDYWVGVFEAEVVDAEADFGRET